MCVFVFAIQYNTCLNYFIFYYISQFFKKVSFLQVMLRQDAAFIYIYFTNETCESCILKKKQKKQKAGEGAHFVLWALLHRVLPPVSGFSLPFFCLCVCLSLTLLSEAHSHPPTNSNAFLCTTNKLLPLQWLFTVFYPLLTFLSVSLSVECWASIHGSEPSYCGPCSSLSVPTFTSFPACLVSPACVHPVSEDL